QLRQLLVSFDHGKKVIAGELSELAGEHRVAVRDEDLRFAVAAGIKQNLSGCGVARVVLERDPEIEIAEWNPRGLSAPARLDQLAAEGQRGEEGGTGLRRRAPLESQREVKTGADEHADLHAEKISRQPSPALRQTTFSRLMTTSAPVRPLTPSASSA